MSYHSYPLAEAPERFSHPLFVLAAFTQSLMMLASNLRASMTDGGSAGLCPLEKAEQYELVMGEHRYILAKPYLCLLHRESTGRELIDRDHVFSLMVCTSYLNPRKEVNVTPNKLGRGKKSIELSLASVAAAPSAAGWKADG